jgi:hypothetical protein
LVIKRKPYAQKVAGLSFGRRTFLPAPPIFSYTVSHRGFRQRSEMDTVRLFAMLCLAVALAGGLAGAALEVRQLVLAASVANNPQQSWGFDGEPPEAVIKDSGTRDGTS